MAAAPPKWGPLRRGAASKTMEDRAAEAAEVPRAGLLHVLPHAGSSMVTTESSQQTLAN